MLLEGSADVNLQVRYGETALHYAAKKGSVEMVKVRGRTLVQVPACSAKRKTTAT